MSSRLAGVVLAGGAGSRLRPVTDHCPKPLLPIAGEPLIAIQLRLLAGLGVREVAVATGYLAEHFAPSIGTGDRYGVDLVYSPEDQPLGTGGALARALAALDVVAGDTVVVLNGDQLTEHRIDRQLHRFRTARRAVGAVATVHGRQVADARAFGLLELGADNRLAAFREKPAEPVAGTVNAGSYVIDPALLQGVSPHRSVSLEREVFPACLASGSVITVFRDDAAGLDIGTPGSYLRANVEAVLGRRRQAVIDPSASIAPGAVVVDGSYVGAHAAVGAGAIVAGSVLLDRATVGAGARVTDCVVNWSAAVPAGDDVHGRVVGD